MQLSIKDDKPPIALILTFNIYLIKSFKC